MPSEKTFGLGYNITIGIADVASKYVFIHYLDLQISHVILASRQAPSIAYLPLMIAGLCQFHNVVFR